MKKLFNAMVVGLVGTLMLVILAALMIAPFVILCEWLGAITAITALIYLLFLLFCFITIGYYLDNR